MRFQFLTNCEKLSEKEKTAYEQLTEINTEYWNRRGIRYVRRCTGQPVFKLCLDY